MDRINLTHAVTATVLLVTASLCGCSEPQRPGEVHGHLVQPLTTEGPFCKKHPFAEVKGGDIQHTVAPLSGEPLAVAADDHPSDAGKLLVLEHPLEALPPEIARIRRGVVKRFTGKFIRDGEMGWSALDLERLVAVSVERRVFDFRSHQSRRVADPVFSRVEELSFARKWTDGSRTEVEVVKVFPITLPEAQLFVCASNPSWANKNPLLEDETDGMAEGRVDVFLLDRREAQGVVYKYTKPIDMTDNLDIVLGGIWQHAPQGPTW